MVLTSDNIINGIKNIIRNNFPNMEFNCHFKSDEICIHHEFIIDIKESDFLLWKLSNFDLTELLNEELIGLPLDIEFKSSAINIIINIIDNVSNIKITHMFK